MRYLSAKCREDDEQFSYRAYIAEALRLQGEGQGRHLTERWMDIVEPKQADNRTGDEIVLEVMKGAGLVYVG